jgi:asparagine synthase (glutamine-hydrolysing)
MAGYASSPRCDVFFVGELYSRDELCSALALRADSRDAELVLSSWEAWGPRAFDRIEGVYALIIRDMREARLWAVRDAMGCRPLFFAQTENGLLFSDTISLLLRHPSVSREVSRLKLAQLSFGRYGEPHETLYRSVNKVPPAHFLHATSKGWDLKQYWFTPDPRPVEDYSIDEAREDFSRRFERAVARGHERGQPLILLSGGLDSISVAAKSADISRNRGEAGPIALSLQFPHPDCDERRVQEAIASALNLRQILLPFDESVGQRGLIEEDLALTSQLSAPLLNFWRPAYLPLINAARRGCDNSVVLTGAGGDEWLGASPLYMADLLKAGRFLRAARQLAEQLRSFDLPLRSALRFQLWNSGLRPLLIEAVRPFIASVAPSIARAVWRRRQQAPAWVAPDNELRRELHLYFEGEVEKHFAKKVIRGPYGFYKSGAIASYIHPLISGDREEDFEVGKLLGLRFYHPYWDRRLIQCLCTMPPELLAYEGYSKGLVRGPVAQRFAGLGLERKKKVSALTFYVERMKRELPPAWESLGGPKQLTKLGVVDERLLATEKIHMLDGGPRELNRVWQLLNMESWIRARI